MMVAIVTTALRSQKSIDKIDIKDLHSNLSHTSKQDDQTPTIFQAIFPSAQNFIKSNTSPPFYYSEEANPLKLKQQFPSIILFSEDFAKGIKGFSGPIKMIIGINNDGEIIKVHVLSHKETPPYISDLDSFLRQFENKKISDPFILNKDIDGISHATITSKAITKSVRISLKKIIEKTQNIPSPQGRNSSEKIHIKEIIIPLVLFIMSIISLYYKKKFLRWATLVISFLYLGLIKVQMLSIIQIANLSMHKIPYFSANPLFYILLSSTLLTLIFWGNLYCRTICPFAFVEEFLFLPLGKKIFKKRIAPAICNMARIARYMLLFLILILSVFFFNSNIANIEVFVLLFTRTPSIWGWILIIVIFLASALYCRFWCRFLCPMGAFNTLIAQFGRKRIDEVDSTHCLLCQKCGKICNRNPLAFDEDILKIQNIIFIILFTLSIILIFNILFQNIDLYSTGPK